MAATALLLLGACAQQPGPANEAPPADAPATPASIAIAVVAERTGIDAAEIELVSSEFRQFSDSGLGCPVEGRSYLQVITPGHQVLVKAGGRQYDVRVAGGNGRICERPPQDRD